MAGPGVTDDPVADISVLHHPAPELRGLRPDKNIVVFHLSWVIYFLWFYRCYPHLVFAMKCRRFDVIDKVLLKFRSIYSLPSFYLIRKL